MSNTAKHNLAYELFGSTIAFSPDNRIACMGGVILKTLTFLGIDVEKIVAENFAGENGQSLLQMLNKARQHHKSYRFKFKKSSQEFLVLPPRGAGGEYVYLALASALNHVNTLEHKLKERVKELECLYNISHELQVSADIHEAAARSTEHIRRALQYPEHTTVIIEIGNKKYMSKGGSDKNIRNMLSDENILKNAKKRGEIKVFYHKKLPFMKEEINLLKEISGKFTKAIEREERTKTLEKQKKILTNKNNKLLELTDDCRESRERLQAFFKAITDRTIVIDTEFKIIHTNSEEIKLFSKCYEELFKTGEVCPECPALITFRNGKTASIELEYANRFYKMQSYPIYNNDGMVEQALEVCRDVTKEKKMELHLHESEKFAALGKLVAGVAHEINNPNTFILGNTKIIKEAFLDLLPLAEAEYNKNPNLKIARLNYGLFKDNISILLDDMYSGATKIKKIVEELRNYARRDEDGLPDTIDINEILSNTVRLLKKQIRENVNVKMELEEGVPTFQGNISRLEQVFINLVTNAGHAIGNAKGEIVVSTEYLPLQEIVHVKVRDNGKGMDEATLHSIFEPFFTTKRSEGGIGLGLSISYKIIKEHKGEIEVDSKLGEGTTFTVIFRLNDKTNGTDSNH